MQYFGNEKRYRKNSNRIELLWPYYVDYSRKSENFFSGALVGLLMAESEMTTSLWRPSIYIYMLYVADISQRGNRPIRFINVVSWAKVCWLLPAGRSSLTIVGWGIFGDFSIFIVRQLSKGVSITKMFLWQSENWVWTWGIIEKVPILRKIKFMK